MILFADDKALTCGTQDVHELAKIAVTELNSSWTKDAMLRQIAQYTSSSDKGYVFQLASFSELLNAVARPTVHDFLELARYLKTYGDTIGSNTNVTDFMNDISTYGDEKAQFFKLRITDDGNAFSRELFSGNILAINSRIRGCRYYFVVKAKGRYLQPTAS